MPRKRIVREGYVCGRCRHEWFPRGAEKPTVCPKCHNPYWDKPKRIARKKMEEKVNA